MQIFSTEIFKILNILMQNALVNVPLILCLLYSSCLHLDVYIGFCTLLVFCSLARGALGVCMLRVLLARASPFHGAGALARARASARLVPEKESQSCRWSSSSSQIQLAK